MQSTKMMQVGILLVLLGLEYAYLQTQGGVEDEHVEGDVGGQRRVEGVCVDGGLPPGHLDVRVALERLAGLEDVVVQELQLAGDEAGIGGVAAPGDDVDGIEAAVDRGAHGGELGHDQRGSRWRSGDGDVVGLQAARGRQAGDAQLDVLDAVVSYVS